MTPAQRDFLKLMIRENVLQFGDFTLKSGRQSPYFFNLGNIAGGDALRGLGQAYASAINAQAPQFDMLFGPAYKGIPIATAAAVALASGGRDVPVAFNRKEEKDHGEGGRFIGAPVAGRVLIVDDVLTAGTAVLEAKEMIEAAGATVAGVVIALDRRERIDDSGLTAVQRVEQVHGLSVVSIVELGDVIEYLDSEGPSSDYPSTMLGAVRAYQQEHCVI